MTPTHIASTLICFIVAVMAAQCAIHIAAPFWSRQPVVHTWDVLRRLHSPQIIREALPPVNKYVDEMGYNITTTLVDQLTATDRAHFLALIQNHYLCNRKIGNVYHPRDDNVWPYFAGHDAPCFATMYREIVQYVDAVTQAVLDQSTIMGAITSRPLTVRFGGMSAAIPVYYIEFLCVTEDRRGRGLAPRLIQTHEYHQRHRNHAVSVSLFKQEDEILCGIVPLVRYETRGYPIKRWLRQWPRTSSIKPPHKMIVISQQNYADLWEFMRYIAPQYLVWIEPCTSNLMQLIQTRNIMVHAIVDLDAVGTRRIVAAYFYRNTCVQMSATDAGAVLTLVGSLRDPTLAEDIFVQGFRASFCSIARKDGYGYCGLELISENGIIAAAIERETAAEIVAPTGWFLYNYVAKTVAANRAFIAC